MAIRKNRVMLNPKSLKYYRDRGYIVDVVEHTIPKTFIKKDLFSCFDLLAIGRCEVIFCQVTTMDNRSKRVRKIFEDNEETFLTIMDAGQVVEIHAWKKKINRWYLTVSRYGGRYGKRGN